MEWGLLFALTALSGSRICFLLVRTEASRSGSKLWCEGGGAGMLLLGVCDQSCPTLCDPMDYSPPGFSGHGISQARLLEWVAIPFSKDLSSGPRDRTPVSRPAGRLSNRLSLPREELLNTPLQDVSTGKCLHSVAHHPLCPLTKYTVVGTALSPASFVGLPVLTHGNTNSWPRCFSGTVVAELQVQMCSSLAPDLLESDTWTCCGSYGISPEPARLCVCARKAHGC